LTFSGITVIGNHELRLQKIIKVQKKKLSDFFKKKILLGNSYARIMKILKFLKNSNFLPTKIDKTADLNFTTQSYPEGTIFF
jgi:hypothetical protein